MLIFGTFFKIAVLVALILKLMCLHWDWKLLVEIAKACVFSVVVSKNSVIDTSLNISVGYRSNQILFPM